MQLHSLPDRELLSQTKQLVQTERDVLTKILHHFREIERRRLFSDFGYSSLFDYAVKELKYSEGQAGRRIQAMRLIKEIPEVEKMIESGELTLTNISQAQSFFREVARSGGTEGGSVPVAMGPKMSKTDKLAILSKLENKSSRDCQKVLINLQPAAALPRERERVLTDDQSEIRFVMSQDLRAKLEEVRSLLGVKGAMMTFAELLTYMTDMSVEMLKAKRFGKRRAAGESSEMARATAKPAGRVQLRSTPLVPPVKRLTPPAAPAPELKKVGTPTASKNTRYISKELRHFVWHRDGRRCVKCKGTQNLNIDHVRPFALGGTSEEGNLRLLCFSCNQRAAVKTFGERRVQGLGSSDY